MSQTAPGPVAICFFLSAMSGLSAGGIAMTMPLNDAMENMGSSDRAHVAHCAFGQNDISLMQGFKDAGGSVLDMSVDTAVLQSCVMNQRAEAISDQNEKAMIGVASMGALSLILAGLGASVAMDRRRRPLVRDNEDQGYLQRHHRYS